MPIVTGTKAIVDSLSECVSRNGQRQHEPEGRRDLSLSHISFSLVSDTVLEVALLRGLLIAR
jgi:hypothetical protein